MQLHGAAGGLALPRDGPAVVWPTYVIGKLGQVLGQRQLHELAHAGVDRLQHAVEPLGGCHLQAHKAYIGQRQLQAIGLGLAYLQAFALPMVQQPVDKGFGLGQADARLALQGSGGGHRHTPTPLPSRCVCRRSSAAVASQQPSASALPMANKPEK